MIALGCDHAGFDMMQEVIGYLEENGLEYKNYGTYSRESCDYPVYAQRVARAVALGECERGILVCGTGIGITIGIATITHPAANCVNSFMAKASRDHNDANVLGLGSRVIGVGTAMEILKTFLETPFSKGERHQKRIQMIEELSLSDTESDRTGDK